MPGIVRANTDRNVKHNDPITPLPFHSFPYVKTGANVFVNGKPAIVVGDKTSCGDEALVGSPNVFINGKAVHRKGDATKGHDKFLPSSAETGSENVFVNGD
tara:strand:- start:2928 stop:3230 length:303 start_codon:yes stop_codon:yes gene_type:complete